MIPRPPVNLLKESKFSLDAHKMLLDWYAENSQSPRIIHVSPSFIRGTITFRCILPGNSTPVSLVFEGFHLDSGDLLNASFIDALNLGHFELKHGFALFPESCDRIGVVLLLGTGIDFRFSNFPRNHKRWVPTQAFTLEPEEIGGCRVISSMPISGPYGLPIGTPYYSYRNSDIFPSYFPL